MALTTPQRVRNRLGYSDITLTDQILEEYIADAEAYIVLSTRRTYSASDLDYEPARQACTDLAAFYSIIRPAGGQAEGVDYKIDEFQVKKSPQLQLRIKTAEKWLQRAIDTINKLVIELSDIPFSTDTVGF